MLLAFIEATTASKVVCTDPKCLDEILYTCQDIGVQVFFITSVFIKFKNNLRGGGRKSPKKTEIKED